MRIIDTHQLEYRNDLVTLRRDLLSSLTLTSKEVYSELNSRFLFHLFNKMTVYDVHMYYYYIFSA